MSEQIPHTVSEIPSAAVFEYQQLVGHRRTDGSFKTTDELHQEYLQRTDRLAHIITEGVRVTDPMTGETSQQRPDYVVWLDKSARPVSWLTKELWPKIGTDANGQPVPMPEFKYVNIDREQWVTSVDPNGTGYMDINSINQSVIRSLRSIFVAPKDKRQGLNDNIDRAPAVLDGKTVLIVDEVMSSGRTLDIATKFFSRAFPTAKIASEHWMGGTAQKHLAQGNADLPVWYKEHDYTGRGVNDRDERVSQQSGSLTQRLGSWFLSTRFPEMDPASVQLRTELRALANDPNVLLIPDVKRDDWDERAERYNGISSDAVIAGKNAVAAVAKQKNLSR